MSHSSIPPVLRRWRFVAAAVAVTTLVGGGVLLAANSDPATALAFHTVPTVRLLDTRPATQVGTRSTPLGLAGTLDLVIPGLPDDATAVNINVTVVDGTEGSFLTLYPAGDPRPLASTINWDSAGAVANTATVDVHAAHTITIFNLKGTVNVVIDLLGYYAPSPVGPVAPASISSGNWGVILRNTIGSPDIDLRAGPQVNAPAPFGAPPFGTGSLEFLVSVGTGVQADQEKASYGNEIDFTGDPVANLTAVGFQVFATGEDEVGVPPNMPGITFEVDPNLTADPTNFSSLVFEPSANSPANQWSPYIDATLDASGVWFLTGAAGTATGCNLSTPCTFTAVKAALSQGTGAVILTAAVTKGRDFAWQGAIDGLRINNEIFDFEETGVRTVTP